MADPAKTGSRDAALFSAIDVLAYPSGFESFGIAFVEACAAGKPVVGCRRGAIPTVIDEGIDGLLVEYREPSGLAVAIIELLQDRARAQRMGQAGRDKVLARYTWPRVAERFRQIYRIAVESAS